MCPGSPYDTAKGQPQPFSGENFMGEKLKIYTAHNAEPQKSGMESVLHLTPPQYLNLIRPDF